MVITCIVAPLALAAILGFAFANGGPTGRLPLGVSGASPELLAAAEHAIGLPSNITVHLVPRGDTLKKEVADGTLSGGVIVSGRHARLSDLLIPIVDPGAAHSPGFRLVSAPSSLAGQEWAQSLAAGLASRIYAGHLQPGSATARGAISIATQGLGNASKGILDYFAPSIAVVFLFVGRVSACARSCWNVRPARWCAWPRRPFGRTGSCSANCWPSSSPGWSASWWCGG
jgi:hypothetical protein